MKGCSKGSVHQPTKSIIFHPYCPVPVKGNTNPLESSTNSSNQPKRFVQPSSSIKKKRHTRQNDRSSGSPASGSDRSYPFIECNDRVFHQSSVFGIEGTRQSQQTVPLVQSQTNQYNHNRNVFFHQPCEYPNNSGNHPYDRPIYSAHNNNFDDPMHNTPHGNTLPSSITNESFCDRGVMFDHSRLSQCKEISNLEIEIQRGYDVLVKKMDHQQAIIQSLMSMMQKLVPTEIKNSNGEEQNTKASSGVNHPSDLDDVFQLTVTDPDISHFESEEENRKEKYDDSDSTMDLCSFLTQTPTSPNNFAVFL